MKSIEFLEPVQDDYSEHLNFIVFEPSSSRIPPSDILASGNEVREIFDTIYNQIEYSSDLKTQILFNRLDRLNMMLDLVKTYDNVIISKFLNKVWRRYGFFSNLGELFMEVETFTDLLPQYNKNDSGIYVVKHGSDDEDGDGDDSDTKDDDEDSDNSDIKDKSDKKVVGKKAAAKK